MSNNFVYEIIFLLIVIASILVINHTQLYKGRIQMCNEIGWKYLYNDKCISNEEYQNKYNSTPNYGIKVDQETIEILKKHKVK